VTFLGFLKIDEASLRIVVIALGLLTFFSVVFGIWRFVKPGAFVREMLTRTFSWWMIFFLYLLFFCIHPMFGQVGLTIVGLMAVREFLEKFPEDRIPMKIRYLAYIFTLLQFYFASQSQYLATAALVPAGFLFVASTWALLFEPLAVAISAPALALWGLLLTNYGLAHLVLLLNMPNVPGWIGSTAGLFLYYIFLTQFNDVLQFLWGTIFGRHKIAPEASPKKTWEGFVGGAVTTTLLAWLLREITPFTEMQSLLVGLGLGVCGYLGDLNISAIKRNLNLKDMGHVIPGHGGVLDRIDSITFSSVLFFYVLAYWFGLWSS
jgi:phosphatidate cytidylyltransferase